MTKIKAYHHSYQTYYREPFGAVECGQKVMLRIDIESYEQVDNCYLRLWEAGQYEKLVPMEESLLIQEHGQLQADMLDQRKIIKKTFESEYTLPQEPGLIWYFFKFVIEGKTYYYGNNPEILGGEGQLLDHIPHAYQITVFKPNIIPLWYKEGMIYQIFVDRFYNGNKEGIILNPKPKSLLHGNWDDTPFYIKDEAGKIVRWNFFGGNLEGIIQKLPYLEELGITILYLNPIFEAASNHKYDTGDYHKIDSMYGNEETFTELIRKAEEHGISIILDGVFNHTGSDSLYFNKYNNYPSIGAYASENSPYYSWYKLKECQGEYDCWWGVDDLPNVDELDPSYQEFIFRGEESVIRTWMKKGVKGWRLDVVDELPDEFVKGLRQTAKEMDSQAVLIGEVWEDASRKVSYGKLREYFWGEELDATMNYPLRKSLLAFMMGKIDADLLVRQVMSLYENYPKSNFQALMNLIGSHDRMRVLTILGEAPPEEGLSEREKENYRLTPEARQLAIHRLQVLALLQMTLPGVPCVYYGDEAGLEGYSDPYNRGTYPWGKEDQEILAWYKRILRLRKEYSILNDGYFQPFSQGEDIFGFSVKGEEEEIIVCINRNISKNFQVELMGAKESSSDILLLDVLTARELESAQIQLEPLEGKVIYKKSRELSQLDRLSGILLPISALPSPWSCGDFGVGARKFIDFLQASEQGLWQILPLNPLGEGDSPYQSSSVFAGNVLLISIESLAEEGLLLKEEIYPVAQDQKENLLYQAFLRFRDQLTEKHQVKHPKTQANREGYLTREAYHAFQEENSFWLEDYCLYKVLKAQRDDLPWYEWEEPIAQREEATLTALREKYGEELEYQRFLQYTFFYQWQELRQYAQQKGIKIIGDLPIYVAEDSCDLWTHAQLFRVDSQGKATMVAGVPPDYFSETGQLWGNPLYSWREMEKDDFAWWKARVKQSLKNFDLTRLDHFRGFEAYWAVSPDETTAVNGRWLKGPGKKFFESLLKEFGKLPFIAEDLGMLTPEVDTLKSIFGFPGMKVYQFSAAEWHLLEGKLDNTVVYTGTHDNETFLGWYTENDGNDILLADRQEACLSIMKELYQGEAPWVIIPLQDVLLHDNSARMNTPGTVEGNWRWRVQEEELTPDVSKRLKQMTIESGRKKY